MSDDDADKHDEAEKPAEDSKRSKAADPPQAGADDDNRPPSREDALKRLRVDTAELDHERAARIVADSVASAAHVNIFQGTISVEGDFNASTRGGWGERPGRTRRQGSPRIEWTELTHQLRYFVPAAGFESGVDILSRDNLVVLSGPRRSGRTTRAFATAVEVIHRHNLDRSVMRLTGHVLGNANWQVGLRDRVLLVIDEPAGKGRPAAESIDDDWLASTARKLADAGCFLVVVTGPVGGKLSTAAGRDEYVLEDMESPDPLEIVRRWVNGEVPWLYDELDDRLSETELADAFVERDDPRFATRAARAVVDALRAGGDLAAAIIRLRDPEDQVREWLGDDPESADIAYVLATAVLEGSSYLKIADAAVGLCHALGGGSGALSPRYFRKQLAERTWIELAPDPDDADAPRVLRFRHARLRPVVLALVWYELDAARDKILRWLRDLVSHTDVEVRARAASTAGILANKDFEYALHAYLQPWAATKHETLQQSVANGLNVAGTVGGHGDAVWRYVEHWADLVRYEGEPRGLPVTAGLAVGGPLGVAHPRRALGVLRTLVHRGDWGLLAPATVSTQVLLDAGRVREVLDALHEWTEPRTDTEPLVKALTMFAFAACGEGDTDDEPALLVAAADHADVLPELWARALSQKDVRPLAVDALRIWVRAVDADIRYAEVVLDLLGGIADEGGDNVDRLLHLLRTWAEDPDDPSAAAADFHDALVDAEEGELTA